MRERRQKVGQMITSEHNEFVCGQFSYSAEPPKYAVVGDKVGRGLTYQTAGGAWGIYVGTSPTGTEYVAYEEATYQEMCDIFDRWYPQAHTK